MPDPDTVFNAIGLGLMGISMIPLADSFFPKVESKYSTLRVAAGLSEPGDSSASTGGSVPGVALFDANGNRVGFQSGKGRGKIDEGNYKGILIAPIKSQNTITPEYMSVVAGDNDALCIAYLALTPTNSEYWALYGDVPKSCGAPWYPLQPGDQSQLLLDWTASRGHGASDQQLSHGHWAANYRL